MEPPEIAATMNALARRLRASLKPAGLHLALSATVALIALALIYGLWYPGALAVAQGVSKLVLILIGVDVVIGPLITLLVYVPGKKSLLFDLMFIAVLQTVALFYGLQAIHGGRPAYVVFSVNRFDVVAYQDVDRNSLGHAAPPSGISCWGPNWAGARMPDDPKKRSDILFSALQGGADLQNLPEYFLPLDALRNEMMAQLRPMDELRKLNALEPEAWKSLLEEFGRAESELGYLPLVGNAKDGAIILDAKSGEVLGLRLLTPSFESPPKPEGASKAPPRRPTQAPAAAQGLG